MQDILQRIVSHFFQSVVCHAELVVLQHIGNDFLLHCLGILLSIQGIDQLHLQLRQFLTRPLRLQEFTHHLTHRRINRQPVIIDGKCPSHQGPLSDMFVLRAMVYVQQGAELHHIETVHQRQRNRRHHQLLVVGIHGRRQQDFLHFHTDALRPDVSCQDVVEQAIHLLLVLLIDCLALLLPLVLRLQLQHGNITDEVLHLTTDSRDRPCLSWLACCSIESLQIGRRHHMLVDGDISTKDIEPLQQALVLIVQLRVTHTFLPIFRHQSVFLLEDIQFLLGLRIRPCGEIGVYLSDGQPCVSSYQLLEDAL